MPRDPHLVDYSAPTADVVAARLREAMLVGKVQPGQPLRDTTLAEQFGVSRNSVREAFRLLQAEGLTSHQRHKGTVVRQLTSDDIRDIYTARRVLELQAVERSSYAPAPALQQLEQVVLDVERLQARQLWRQAGVASLRFHQLLVATLGSPSLDSFMSIILTRLRLVFASMPVDGASQAPWAPRDRAVNDLLQRGKIPAALTEMRLYLNDAEADVLSAFRSQIA